MNKKEIIEIGNLLWQKNLATGLNGNISLRADSNKILITGHKTCLGTLREEDIVLTDLDGKALDGGKVSSETLLHTQIYKNFPEMNAVIHTHPTYTNGFFVRNTKLSPSIFESRLYLGAVSAIDQTTPTVTDVAPVIAALKKSRLIVLRNHGVVAMGESLFDCFLLIQSMEEAVKVEVISRLYHGSGTDMVAEDNETNMASRRSVKCKMFSKEQIDKIVELVNNDEAMKDLGAKTNMDMELAVKMNETGQVHSFTFKKGQIVNVGENASAEFVISAPEDVWRAVFNCEIDPFVATTQKKMNLQGDFARISKWYAPCNRIFELWTQVPVE